MTNSLDIALSVALDLGLPVFPCMETLNEKGKVSKRPYTRNGFKDACREEVQIRKWWGQHPNALIGVPTGEQSGIFVIDIDQSDVKDGEASFHALGVNDPMTCQTKTVSGGRHIIFKYPDGYNLKNTTSGPLGNHIDTRGNGGYVIWAGSKTCLGDYQYREGFTPNETSFCDLPPQLLNMLVNTDEEFFSGLISNGPIPEGKRNDTLFREGVRLANKGVSDDLVREHIQVRAKDCQGTVSGVEIHNIQNSALSYKGSVSIPFTDLGNGERLVRDWGQAILYCSDQKSWYAWSGTHWIMDEQCVKQYAKQTTRNMHAEQSFSAEMLQHLAKWQKSSESIARQNAMLEAGSSDPKVTRPYEVFTKDEHLFSLQNGTFDLKKQTLREHKQSDHITKIANASLNKDADCRRWITFVDEVTNGDRELALFLQKLCGYMLSGHRGEQIILFLVDDGANGKSVFLSVLKHVFGSYAAVINSKALIERNANSIPSDIAGLANKRFVMMSEFPEHAPLNTGTVKSITGGDPIAARHLYKEWFEFKPQFQVVCALNELPKLTWVDEAYFRRVRIVPFGRVFAPHERDKNLEAKLIGEADGIMKWMIEGYQLYKAKGLEPTTRMDELLVTYQSNENPLRKFVETQVQQTDHSDFIPVQNILDAFHSFCEREGIAAPDEMSIRRGLRARFGKTCQRRVGHHNAATRGWAGYRIIEVRENDYPF